LPYPYTPPPPPPPPYPYGGGYGSYGDGKGYGGKGYGKGKEIYIPGRTYSYTRYSVFRDPKLAYYVPYPMPLPPQRHTYIPAEISY
jgi:hypothetical protein